MEILTFQVLIFQHSCIQQNPAVDNPQCTVDRIYKEGEEWECWCKDKRMDDTVECMHSNQAKEVGSFPDPNLEPLLLWKRIGIQDNGCSCMRKEDSDL